MKESLESKVQLNNGILMPRFGLGVFRSREGGEVEQAVEYALKMGYRLIDTASIYANERGVGQGIRQSGIHREEIFITSKVWNSDQGFDSTLHAFDLTLERLDTDYLDLYLIHWPVAGKFVQTWKAMERLLKEGRVRAIGVSNFLEHHLEELSRNSDLIPAVNQIEYHPYLQQPALARYCLEFNIVLEAWGPIMRGRVNEISLLQEIGRHYGKSAVQVTLRWEWQKGIVVIPKSVREDRIRSNADIFDFALTQEEMNAIDALDRNERFGAHPDHFDF